VVGDVCGKGVAAAKSTALAFTGGEISDDAVALVMKVS
jgi:hypothetical protein